MVAVIGGQSGGGVAPW